VVAGADGGRAAVYAAEIAAFEGTTYESITSFESLEVIVADVVGAAWWPSGAVEVRRARSDAASSSARQRGGDTPVIRLAAPQMTPATVVHELAHALAGVGAGHGPAFRRAHVDLVGHVFGDDEACWLLEAYAAMGLGPGIRTWPQPPVRPGRGRAVAL
jgi:putative metallohydrolase (TIGR04338 family)